MNVAFVECGLPFSGKSHLANSIAESVGGRIVRFDEARIEGETSGLIRAGMTKERAWNLTEQLGYMATLPPLDDEAPVINDAVNPTLVGRERFQNWLFLETGKRSARIPILVFMNTPLDEIYRRMAQNEQRATRDPVSPANFDRILTTFEPPRPEEQAIELHSIEEAEAWVRDLPANLDTIKRTAARHRLERILRKYRLLDQWGIEGPSTLDELTDQVVSGEIALEDDLHRTTRGLAWRLLFITRTATAQVIDLPNDAPVRLDLKTRLAEPPLEAAL